LIGVDAVGAFYFAHPFWSWLAVGAVFLIAEVTTGSGWLLWPAGSAAAVGLLSLAAPRLGGGWELVLVAAVTVISTVAGRRWLRGVSRDGPDINDPGARLIGHRGQASHAFEAGLGRVFVDGKEWSAELDGAGVVAAGATVQVIAVLGGARLRVRAL
jgi:membrane protein implicated in regulation of membrane protease activity